MTEQIHDLLHAGADAVDVPPPPTTAILTEGRRLRRRTQLVRGGAVTAGIAGTAAVVALALVLAQPHPAEVPRLAPAVAPDPAGWAVAQGSTVHLGSGKVVEVPGKVKAMYYTSSGVMVRTGKTAWTDAADSNYFVLENDGDVRDFSLHLGDKKPGTDPTLPYLAYAVKGADATHWELVLRDVRTGEVATRIPFEGAFTWGGWNAPPTALSGDYAYVGLDKATMVIDWRTGKVVASKVLPPSRMPTVSGGRELLDPQADVAASFSPAELQGLDQQEQVFRVIDARAGTVLRSVTVDPEGWPRLSPDGRHVFLAPMGMCDADTNECHYDDPEAHVISVDTGADRSYRLQYGGYGWTPDGRLLLVDKTQVRSCDADTGDCVATPVTLDGNDPMRISGNDNES